MSAHKWAYLKFMITVFHTSNNKKHIYDMKKFYVNK
jgi:hypothetical protein